jgi:hypothetical protein
MKIRVLCFEGRVDVLFYGTLLRKVFGYKQVKRSSPEEIEIKRFLSDFGEIIPIDDSTILKKDRNWFFLKAENGKDSLKDECCTIGEKAKFVERKSRQLNIDFLSLFLFDNDANADEEVCRNCLTDNRFATLLVETPEKLVVKAFSVFPGDQRTAFENCRQIIIQPDTSYSKRLKQEFTLIKAVIGWKCYYNLFENILEHQECKDRILSMIPDQLIQIFKE